MEKIHIHRADRVFVLSDDGELEHDSVSISALVQISAILGAAHRRDPLPCHLSFEYQSSFQVFQLADFEEAERMKSRIHFSATNFHENWAQRVLVSGCCNCNGRDILYPPLDRDGIRAQSDRYVHLIVVGMSRMGVAMGVTAAHIAHYPNFVTQGIRTRITFIDPDAEREMNFLKGRYEPLFRLSHHTLRKFDAAGSETTNVHTPAGRIFWTWVGIRRRRHRIAPRAQTAQRLDGRRKERSPTLAICGNSAPENVAAALYLPQTALRPASSDLVYQKETATILEIARRSSRYRSVYPFGMMCEKLRRHTQTAHPQGQNASTTSTTISPMQKAAKKQRTNSMKSSTSKLSQPDSKLPIGQTIRSTNTGTINRWRSNGRTSTPPTPSPPNSARWVSIPAVRIRWTGRRWRRRPVWKHNRWKRGGLLMGYRPATTAERERANADDEYTKC